MSTETSALLSSAIAGNESSWDALFREFNPMLRSIAAGYRLDEDTCSDVCQTVWMRLYENGHKIRRPEALSGWLATTTRNEALRCIRRMQRARPCGVLADEVDANSPSPDERAIDDETLHDVLHAFGQLPDDSQQLMRLLVASPPLPYSDIAERVGRPIGSIGPTRSRCIDTMKAFLAEPEPDPEPALAA